jgi:hypothetical protein
MAEKLIPHHKMVWAASKPLTSSQGVEPKLLIFCMVGGKRQLRTKINNQLIFYSKLFESIKDTY